MYNILVTSIGSVAGDIVIKNLKRNGHRVIGGDINPKNWLVDSYSVDSFYQTPYVSDELRYFDYIICLCKKEKIDYIIPLTDLDVDFYNKFRDDFLKNNVKICISNKESIEICRNKKLLEEYVNKNCNYLNTIPTILLNKIEKPMWDYPLVCKPYDGRSSQGVFYIHNEFEWQAMKTMSNNDKYIVQPYIEGFIEMVEIIAQPKFNIVVAITRRELIATPHGCGISVYVYRNNELENKVKQLTQNLNIIGCVNFEFINNNGVYYLVECNPRFSAGVEFSCLAGYDCVINNLKCFEGKRIESFELKNNFYIARKYEEFITEIEMEK
ncbi:MAG: carbamoyl-phosphate synthase large subunit [Phascolarctobacterium sp.]|nr:MAG: carbamoyl-phosphate synthase large subunit [Phascolarctobacterium sp.]